MAALSTGVELNAGDNEALVWAALDGNIPAIQAWLEAGGDVNADVFYPHDFDARAFPTRILHLAACHAQGKLVRVLIANGADVNFESHSGMSALQRAVAVPRRDPTKTAQLLIEAGADLFNQDLSKRNRLLYSATRHPDILRALLRAGIRVDGRDEDGADVEASLQKDLANYMEFGASGQAVLSRKTYEQALLSLKESARILEGARLAGSYKRYFLAPHHGMLALRALVLRGRAEASLPKSLAIRKLVMSGDLSGRAKASLSTNLFFARLFSGTTAEVVNQIKVFNFYTTEGTGDEGCNVNFVARSLAMDLDQVKQIVEFFCFTGYLYPVGICDWTAPIDDDHHKSVAVVPLPDPPTAAPSLLPDPVFFLILQYWLGGY